jgi:hypothetical protein
MSESGSSQDYDEVVVAIYELPLGITLNADSQGVCHVVMSKRPTIKVGDLPYCLNEQPIPRGLKSDEVEAILQLAQLPFNLILLRRRNSAERSIKGKLKAMWAGGASGVESSSTKVANKKNEDEVNVILGRDEWAPLGMTFQTCADGSHRIIFVDPDGQGTYGGIKVGDCVVGINYKPLSFGYTHDEAVDLIRKTKKPFTLNLIRKRPDEVAGLVGQVKTAQACKEIISAKDAEIATLRTQLLAAKDGAAANSAAAKDAEITRLKEQVNSLQTELWHVRATVGAGGGHENQQHQIRSSRRMAGGVCHKSGGVAHHHQHQRISVGQLGLAI